MKVGIIACGYLGIDICCTSRARRKVAATRATDFADRAKLIATLPSHQRDMAIYDGNAALYLGGGCIYTATQLKTMASQAAVAMFGRKPSCIIRSRDAAHLVGAGAEKNSSRSQCSLYVDQTSLENACPGAVGPSHLE